MSLLEGDILARRIPVSAFWRYGGGSVNLNVLSGGGTLVQINQKNEQASANS